MASPQPGNGDVHFVLIPLMCPGHLIPVADMARLIAQHQATVVTIITTPANAARIKPSVRAGSSIRLAEVSFPSLKYGLPEGCENVEDLPSMDLTRNFFFATKELQHPIEQLLRNTSPNPSCIVSDKVLSWTVDLARSLEIPRIVFDGMSCFNRLLVHCLHLHKPYESVSDSSEKFMVPGIPGGRRIKFTRAQLPGLFNPSSVVKMEDIRKEIIASEEEAYGVVVNSFEELEPEYVAAYMELKKEKIWCIGPVSLCNNSIGDMFRRGNKHGIDKTDLVKWLDSYPPRSIVYCCLGSLNRVPSRQMIELGLGLEASRRPFVWVIRGAFQGPELDTWLEKDGFEERVGGRGLLIRGWAPQMMILSHPSVGCFLTHCGWNSTLEGVASGLPMVTWPLFAEQFFNEKEVVEVVGVGVAVGAKAVVHLGEEEKDGVWLVKSEDVRVAVEKVMDEGEEGEERRRRSKELKVMAEKAVVEGGSSYNNVIAMVEDIRGYMLRSRYINDEK